MLLKQRRQKATACQDATLPDRIALSSSGCVKHSFSSTPLCPSCPPCPLPGKPRSWGASPDDPSALDCVNLHPASCQTTNHSVSRDTTFSVYLAPAIIFLLVCSLCAYSPIDFVSGCQRSILDDDNDDETRRPRPSSSGTHASRASGLE